MLDIHIDTAIDKRQHKTHSHLQVQQGTQEKKKEAHSEKNKIKQYKW